MNDTQLILKAFDKAMDVFLSTWSNPKATRDQLLVTYGAAYEMLKLVKQIEISKEFESTLHKADDWLSKALACINYNNFMDR